jgi:hypothetical protein
MASPSGASGRSSAASLTGRGAGWRARPAGRTRPRPAGGGGRPALQRVGGGQLLQGLAIQLRAQCQILRAGEGAFEARGADAVRLVFGQAADQPQPQPHHRQAGDVGRGHVFERAVPVAVDHIHRAHPHAVALRVLHQLAGRVEAQRLAVEHGGQELGRVVALDPAAVVDQQREADRVAFGEAVAGEALDLLDHALREVSG